MIEVTYTPDGRIHQFHETVPLPDYLTARAEMTGMTTRVIPHDLRTVAAIARDAERWRVVESDGAIDFKLVE